MKLEMFNEFGKLDLLAYHQKLISVMIARSVKWQTSVGVYSGYGVSNSALSNLPGGLEIITYTGVAPKVLK
jgi:hypothetical protein